MKRRTGDWTTFYVCMVIAASLTPAAQAQVQNQVFTTIAPCRLIDTRNATAGKMSANEARTFGVYGDLHTQGGPAGGCGLPTFTADGAPRIQALAINYVAVNAEAQGNLKAWASELAEPTASIINFGALNPPTNLANGTITAVRQDIAGADLTIRASQKVHVVADVVGYFQRSAVRTEITGNETIGPVTRTPNVIGGAVVNSVAAGVIGATIGGGGQALPGPGIAPVPNTVTNDWGTVGGGYGNTAGAYGTTVAGGVSNSATGEAAAVGGGAKNSAAGSEATVSGGSDNIANGSFATVLGGFENFAEGDYSLAAGRLARANAQGSFVWADSQDFPFSTNTQNLFRVRATGGIGLVTAIDSSGNVTKNCFINTSANLSCDGTINGGSDRASKENFTTVDDRRVLQKVAALPIEEWNYKSEGRAVHHIGPMAQDFAQAFAVGADDKHIAMVDADGVALAAIKGLYAMLRERDRHIAELEAREKETSLQLSRMEARHRDEMRALATRLETPRTGEAAARMQTPLATRRLAGQLRSAQP